MSAIDLNERLADLSEQITEINEQAKTLTQKRTSALQQQDEETGKTIRHQLEELQFRLEDLVIMKTAIEGKLRVYKGNAQKAAGIRKQIAGELWPKGTKSLSKAQQALADLSNAIQEIDQLNGSIAGLAAEHERLIGEMIPVPAISNFIPQDLRRIAIIRLPELPETLELKVNSQQIREAQEKLAATFEKKMAKQKTQILPYLESANQTWPRCKTCSTDLVCIGASVYDGSQREIALGDRSELRERAFRLQFRCETGPHNGPAGFIRIEGGPYETVHLTQLEIDREP